MALTDLQSAAYSGMQENVIVDEPQVPEWIRTSEAAEIMGIHEESVRRLCRLQKIECRKWVRSWQVSYASAIAYVKPVGGRGHELPRYDETNN